MRKGFTMIELIFVIVILGVLASVAIPRLAATRDDAEVAKAATNLTTAVSDITAYYTAKGSFFTTTSSGKLTSSVISDFTKVTNALNKNGELMVKGRTVCAKIVLPTNDEIKNGNVKVKVQFGQAGQNDAVCTQLRKLPGIMAMCGTDTTQSSATVGSGSSDCAIQVGGSGGIQF